MRIAKVPSERRSAPHRAVSTGRLPSNVPVAPLLALQRSVGNAGVARLVSTAPGPLLQRNGDWMLKDVRTYKKLLDKPQRFGAGPGTLHHHISQHTLSSLNDEIVKAQKSRDKDVMTAVQAFVNVVNRLVLDMLKALTESNVTKDSVEKIDLETRLANLPLNLHYGPRLVASNPGHLFDPSTVPLTGGKRTLDPVSEFGIFEEGMTEQWIEGAGEAWHKRGDLTFGDLKEARKHFHNPVPEQDQTIVPERIVSFTVDCQDEQVDVRIGATRRSVTHFCNRHTYAHFDVSKIKGVNIFWPDGTDRPDLVNKVDTVARSAWDHIKSIIDPATLDAYELEGAVTKVIGGEGLKRADNGIYYMVIVRDHDWDASDDDTNNVKLEITMLAPTARPTPRTRPTCSRTSSSPLEAGRSPPRTRGRGRASLRDERRGLDPDPADQLSRVGVDIGERRSRAGGGSRSSTGMSPSRSSKRRQLGQESTRGASGLPGSARQYGRESASR